MADDFKPNPNFMELDDLNLDLDEFLPVDGFFDYYLKGLADINQGRISCASIIYLHLDSTLKTGGLSVNSLPWASCFHAFSV